MIQQIPLTYKRTSTHIEKEANWKLHLYMLHYIHKIYVIMEEFIDVLGSDKFQSGIVFGTE